MCELLGLSSRLPTDVNLSLAVLADHGGGAGPHRDGWGIAFFDGGDAHRFRDVAPANESPLVAYLSSQQLRSTAVIAHVRLARQGDVALRNTQPFTRELHGRCHVFAHNGLLQGLERVAGQRTGRFVPMGETDSELAFCMLLRSLSDLGPDAALSARIAAVARFAATIRPLGPANFVFSDGDTMFVHGNRRTQPTGEIAPPGIWTLERECLVTEPVSIGPALTLRNTDATQSVVLAASVPLSSESWRPLGEGQLLVARGGEVLEMVAPQDEP